MTSFKLDKSIGSFFSGGKIFIQDNKIYSVIKDSFYIVDLTAGTTNYHLINESDDITSFTISSCSSVAIITTKSFLTWKFDLICKKIVASWKIHTSPVLSLHLNESNEILAIGYVDRTVKLWDIVRGTTLFNLKSSTSPVNVFRFLSDHQLSNGPASVIFGGCLDGKIYAWDVDSGKCISKIDAHASVITGIDLSACGYFLVSFSRDKVVCLISIKSFRIIKSLMVSESVESGVILHSTVPLGDKKETTQDSVVVALGGESGVLFVWNLMSGICLGKNPSPYRTGRNPVIISDILINKGNDELVVVTSDHNMMFYQMKNQQELSFEKSLCGYHQEITDIACLNGSIVVASNSETVRVYEENRLFECANLIGHSDVVLCLAVKPSCSASMGDLIVSGSKDNSIRLWMHIENKNSDQNSPKVEESFACLNECIGHTEAVGAVAFNNKSERTFFVSGAQDRTMKLWNVPNNAQIGVHIESAFTVKGHDKDINSVAISPNDRFIATSSQDKTIKLWNVSDGSPVTTLTGHKRGVSCVVFSPVEQILASSSADKTIRIWSVSDYTCIKTFEGHSTSVLKILFVNGGADLVSISSDGIMKVWNVKSAECIGTFDEHTDKIWALAISSTSHMLFTGGADSLINVWRDVTEEEKQKQIQDHNDIVVQEQSLANSIRRKDYKNALYLAFKLEQPFKFYHLVEDVILLEGYNSPTIGQAVLSLNISEEVPKLLEFCKEWNTSFKKSFVSQLLLNILFRSYSVEGLIKVMPNIQNTVESLLAYTNRHIQRLDQLYQDTYLIDYVFSLNQ